MTGDDAQGYATGFGAVVDTLFKISNTPGGLLVVLMLGVLVLGFGLWRLRKKLEGIVDAKFADLTDEVTKCRKQREECESRDRQNLLAIATLHGVLRGIESKIEGHVAIPSLAELFSGKWSTAAAYNSEVVNLGSDGSVVDPSQKS